LPGEVPVGVEPTGVPGGEEETTGSVTFGKFTQEFEGGGVIRLARWAERLEDKFMG